MPLKSSQPVDLTRLRVFPLLAKSLMASVLASTVALSLLGAVRADTPATPAAPPDPIVAPTDTDKALAARAEAAIPLAMGTPGQEEAVFLKNGWPHSALDVLEGKTPATQKQIDGAVGMVNYMLVSIEAGPTWPRPPLTSVSPVRNPETDGVLDETAWKTTAVWRGAYSYNVKDKPDDPDSSFKVAWDSQYLYLGYDCADANIEAPVLPHDASVWKYDCVEAFILPDITVGKYWELNVSPTGSVFDALWQKNMNAWGSPPGGDKYDMTGLVYHSSMKFDPANPTKVTGFVTSLAVPFSQLPGYEHRKPKAGDRLWIQMVHVNKDGDTTSYCTPTPSLSWGHNIWSYIPIELAKR